MRRALSHYPAGIFETMLEVAGRWKIELYLSGGALRDWLHGVTPNDLDFTISRDAARFLEEVKILQGAGTLVHLGERHDDSCRLVIQGRTIDVTGFRTGAATIEEDLKKRDFTINAMGAKVNDILDQTTEPYLIDPLDGLGDLQRRLIRVCPGAFSDDPLRMVRAFRFAALLDFRIDLSTITEISTLSHLLSKSAAERIRYEFDQIMMSFRASDAVYKMAETGLLLQIAPELLEGEGVSQPPFHHLDVLQHNMFTLECLERIIAEPRRFFSTCPEALTSYISDLDKMRLLKWAALFHDAGKPATKKIVKERDNRITFHTHEDTGSRMFGDFAARLRWSTRDKHWVSDLIAMHMHPFHLCNVLCSEGKISTRARLKICRRTGEDLAGLFLLALADSLAGKGPEKPEGIEKTVAELYCELEEMYEEVMRPVINGPKLLTGHDLIDTLGLAPGPQFKEILEAVEMAALEGKIVNREDALAWVRRSLAIEK
jgi:poly(A) polymerase